MFALTEIAKVYLIVHCNESDLETSLGDEFLADFRFKHHILLHSTDIGKIAIVRQLKSTIHVEYDETVRTKLSAHVSHVLLANLSVVNSDSSQSLSSLSQLTAIDLRPSPR